jgi:hypothetical protein
MSVPLITQLLPEEEQHDAGIIGVSRVTGTEEISPAKEEFTQPGGYNRDVRSDSYSDPQPNRADDTVFTERDSVPISITLQRIDAAIIGHLKEGLKPVILEAGREILVPVEYANAERWKQIRKDGVVRDGAGKIQTPIILLHRTSLERGALTNPIGQYMDRTFQTGWNRHNTYDKFAVLNGIIPSRKLVSVKVPDYYTIVYEGMIWTDYVEQMNDLVELISYESDDYWGDRGDFKFNVRINGFTLETDIPEVGDRAVKTSFNMNVKGYLLPETFYHTDKGIQTTTQKRYTRKKVINFYEIDNTGGE